MIPRSEYPRPQFVRDSWLNLNGEWEFFNDLSASGMDKEIWKSEKFDSKITVPFCPESDLSGIGYKDFMPSVWYAKNIEVTKEQLAGRVILHFGACDYVTTVFVNGKKIGKHVGGYTSFEFDITDALTEGNNRMVVNAFDDVRSEKQPAGKQSSKSYSYGCFYTRTTGIWQTVWLEFVPENYLSKVKVNATDLGGKVLLETTLNKYVANAVLKVEAYLEGEKVADESFALCGVTTSHSFDVSQIKLWAAGEPNLYDVTYTLYVGEKAVDTVNSYFGIRRIDIDGYHVRINGKSVFQRLILDQGFYPDGIYTAPTAEALKRDIEICMNLGFNGARLHEKVFEERFLYYADKMGYLVWGEYPNWGIQVSDPMTLHTYLPEWLESVERDYNHPSIIGWCPYNETQDRQIDSNVSAVYLATKAVDSTRPVIDTSGWRHTEKTDIYDVHNYNQDANFFRELKEKHLAGEPFVNKFNTDRGNYYDGKAPYMISEYGGIKWIPQMDDNNDRKVSWGYGNAPKTMEEFCDRYCGITAAIMEKAINVLRISVLLKN